MSQVDPQARALIPSGGPPPLLQVLVYPACDIGMDTESWRDFAEGFGLDASAMRWSWETYLAGADGTHADASPLRAPDLRGSAPAQHEVGSAVWAAFARRSR